MKDERFDMSADMRLLELQRRAIGAPVHVLHSTRYTDTDPLTAEVTEDEAAPAASGTILVAQLDAQPRRQLIPGALITIALSISNDGDEVGRRVWASLPLPIDTLYRHGTMLVDGTPASEDSANDYFGNGIDLGDILPGARRTVTLKVMLDAGLRDVILSPHVGAASGAVLGLLAIRLVRSGQSHLSLVAERQSRERPFYESDEAEHALEALPPTTTGQRQLEAAAEFPPIVPPQMAEALRQSDREDSRAAVDETTARLSDLRPSTKASDGNAAPAIERTELSAKTVPTVRSDAPSTTLRQEIEKTPDSSPDVDEALQRQREAAERERDVVKRQREAARLRRQAKAQLEVEAAATLAREAQREQEATHLREQEATRLREQEAAQREIEALQLAATAAAELAQEALIVGQREAAALREREAEAREREAREGAHVAPALQALEERGETTLARQREQQEAQRAHDALRLREQQAVALREQQAAKREQAAAKREHDAEMKLRDAAKRQREAARPRPQEAAKRGRQPLTSADQAATTQSVLNNSKVRLKDGRDTAATIAAKAQTIAESIHMPVPPEPIASIISGTIAKASTIAKAKTKPKANAKSAVRDLAPHEELRAHAEVDVVAGDLIVAAKGGPILTVRIDRKRLASLARLFNGKSLGMIAHYLVLNALATTQAPASDGEDFEIAHFVGRQEQLLSRALISARLGKNPDADSVAAQLPAFPPNVANHSDQLRIPASGLGQAVLVRAFQRSEIEFLERMLSNTKAPTFLRAAQLFVALCATSAGAASDNDRRPVSDALAAYAALATTEISRLFLRAKLSGTPNLFYDTEAAFDAAARAVLDELGKLIA